MIFKLYWKDGTTEFVNGDTIATACAASGIQTGALEALDFYSQNPDEKYEYDKFSHTWIKINQTTDDQDCNMHLQITSNGDAKLFMDDKDVTESFVPMPKVFVDKKSS